MSEIAQIAHVLIFGIPIDVRLSANAYVNPIVALVAPALGGLVARHHGMVAAADEDLERGRPDRGQRAARRPAVGARQRRGERADHDLQRLRRLGRPRSRLHPDRRRRGVADRAVPQSAPQRSAADRRLRRGGGDRGRLRRADHRRVLCLRADRRRLCGGERGADPRRFARGRADRAISRRRAVFAGDCPCRQRRPRAISGADRPCADRRASSASW